MRPWFVCTLLAGLAACKLTPTRDVRRMAEAAADPNSGLTASDVHVITLNQLLSKTTYTCATHRDVVAQRPGRCPVCSDELVAMPRELPVSQADTDSGKRRED